jgi:hypothetical protein
MNAEQIVLDAIFDLTGKKAVVSDEIADFFDSLSLVEFAITLGDKIDDDSIFESHEFFSSRTILDIVRVVESKM